MGTGFHGGFGGTGGGGRRSIDDNAKEMSSVYPFTSSGYFGEKGKNARVIKSATPEATSIDFYHRIGKGGETKPLANGHGTITTLSDGTKIVHRLITSTKDSPAVDIKVIKSPLIKSQKIHFVKEVN